MSALIPALISLLMSRMKGGGGGGGGGAPMSDEEKDERYHDRHLLGARDPDKGVPQRVNNIRNRPLPSL